MNIFYKLYEETLIYSFHLQVHSNYLQSHVAYTDRNRKYSIRVVTKTTKNQTSQYSDLFLVLGITLYFKLS